MAEFGSLNHGPGKTDRVQPFIRNFCSISCSVLLLTDLLSNLNIYSPFRLQTTDIMVTQPSTCLRLSDNTAGAITSWRRLPEKFCRNPIEIGFGAPGRRVREIDVHVRDLDHGTSGNDGFPYLKHISRGFKSIGSEISILAVELL